MGWAWARLHHQPGPSRFSVTTPYSISIYRTQLQLRIAWGRRVGPLVACVYGADKALPLHDTYIHIQYIHSLKIYLRQVGGCWCRPSYNCMLSARAT